MIVKTKKYVLTPKAYMNIAIRHRAREDWWVFGIAAVIACFAIFIHSIWFPILAIIGLSGYFLFWFLQFYGVRYLEQAQMLFLPATYEISGKQIMIKLASNKGMPIEWKNIKKVLFGRDYFLIVISKAHLIYLPYKIFNGENDIKFLKFLFLNKKVAS